jgi:hypothetical protein
MPALWWDDIDRGERVRAARLRLARKRAAKWAAMKAAFRSARA